MPTTTTALFFFFVACAAAVSHASSLRRASLVLLCQDIDNAHVDIESVRGEFGIKEEDLQLRIAVVSGDKLIWGAQAIMEICQVSVCPQLLFALN